MKYTNDYIYKNVRMYMHYHLPVQHTQHRWCMCMHTKYSHTIIVSDDHHCWHTVPLETEVKGLRSLGDDVINSLKRDTGCVLPRIKRYSSTRERVVISLCGSGVASQGSQPTPRDLVSREDSACMYVCILHMYINEEMHVQSSIQCTSIKKMLA